MKFEFTNNEHKKFEILKVEKCTAIAFNTYAPNRHYTKIIKVD